MTPSPSAFERAHSEAHIQALRKAWAWLDANCPKLKFSPKDEILIANLCSGFNKAFMQAFLSDADVLQAIEDDVNERNETRGPKIKIWNHGEIARVVSNALQRMMESKDA